MIFIRDGWSSRDDVGTQSHGTVRTGTKICGAISVFKSFGTTNPEISGQESRSVPLSQDSMWRKSCSVPLSRDSILRIFLIVSSFNKISRNCRAWLSHGTSGTGTKKYAGLSCRVPYLSLLFTIVSFVQKFLHRRHRVKAKNWIRE